MFPVPLPLNHPATPSALVYMCLGFLPIPHAPRYSRAEGLGLPPLPAPCGRPLSRLAFPVPSARPEGMVCEEYRDGSVRRRLVEGSYGCFISKDGEWTCPSESDTKIRQLD